MWLVDLVLTILGGGLWLMIYAFSGNAKKAKLQMTQRLLLKV